MEFITYEQEGFVGVITINRPKALNALNSQVLDELNEVLDTVDVDKTRAIVLTGAGEKSFVAGADIGEMSTLTKAEGEAFGKKGNDVFRKLETLPVPVIAAVNGFALGGGCEISMSCDIRLCSDTAIFGQPEVGLGITPGFGGTQRLARLVSPGMAKQLIYTARNIKADEAYRIGLVNAVYSATLDEAGNVTATAQENLHRSMSAAFAEEVARLQLFLLHHALSNEANAVINFSGLGIVLFNFQTACGLNFPFNSPFNSLDLFYFEEGV